MRLPRPSFEGSSARLPDLAADNRREGEARERILEDFSLAELFLGLSSKDSVTKSRVEKTLAVRDDAEMVLLASRLVREAAGSYQGFSLQWQRKVIGYLTSLGAEAMSRLGGEAFSIPDGLDFAGLEARGGDPGHTAIKARRIGDFAGVRASRLDLVADSIGDFALREAECCSARAGRVGNRLGEDGVSLKLHANEAGDWLMLKSRDCYVEARRVGSLAGLDSRSLEIHVHSAGAELCERARDAVIYLRRGAKSLGQTGSGVLYVRRGSPGWRTCFRVERMR